MEQQSIISLALIGGILLFTMNMFAIQHNNMHSHSNSAKHLAYYKASCYRK